MRCLTPLGLCLLAAQIAACGSSWDNQPPQPELGWSNPAFERNVVSLSTRGAAFITAADLDGKVDPDGKTHDELIVSSFGRNGGIANGSVTIFSYDGALDKWITTPVVTPADDIQFPNKTKVVDMDGDQDLDIILPAGFFPCVFVKKHCGLLAWFEQTPTGWIRHNIIGPGAEYYYHNVGLVDLDGDQFLDILTVGEQRIFEGSGYTDKAVVQWVKGANTETGFESELKDVAAGLGGLVNMLDLDDDGDMDLASSEYFTEWKTRSFAWMEQVQAPSADQPTGVWQRHVIADDVGPAIQLSLVPNLIKNTGLFSGDRELYAIGSNHTCEERDRIEAAVYIFQVPNDPKTSPWPKIKITEDIVSRNESGMFAPGIFGWGDVDNDGDIDIALSGDGDPRVFALLQQPDGSFENLVLQEDLGQAGGQLITDLDKDGIKEIVVAGYENDAVLIYKWLGTLD